MTFNLIHHALRYNAIEAMPRNEHPLTPSLIRGHGEMNSSYAFR